MEESKNYRHHHPLLLLDEEQLINNQSGVADCSKCGEKVSSPCFSCAEYCGFYLHKVCAAAPLEINHPFHRDHPLVLMQKPPYSFGTYICDFCDKTCEKFFYHCPDLDFHIICALFTFNIAENNLKELEHFVCQDPLVSTKNDDEELEEVRKCFGCWEPLANYTHFSPYCGFNLHKKCAELPLELSNICHCQHPLVLQFNSERLSCKICKVTQKRGFVYGCSSCKLVFHIECLSPPLDLAIEDESHQHTFTRLLRRVPYICDACGIEGIYNAYICCTCNIMVHKRCTSLPRIIKSKWHDHCIFHKYFLRNDFKSSSCIICHDEVNPKHGSYSCSYCNIKFHLRCVTEEKSLYSIVSLENEYEISNGGLEILSDKSVESATCVFERNDAGEATKIKHFKHLHDLKLSPFVGGYENNCNGCMLPISEPFYYCLECVFFLHKVCAELPKVKHVWHHPCQQPLSLISNKAFCCGMCWHVSNAFAYECCKCETKICLRCMIAFTPGARTCLKHEHPLFFYRDYKGRCNACSLPTWAAFCCKDCNFVLHRGYFSLPITAHHKCDVHLLSLTDHDDNSYSESHYCDICEESRDPNLWFYHCAACDTSVHVGCVLGQYPFFKLGSIYEDKDHPHPLTIVKKIYYYPKWDKCGKLCEDLALECSKSDCKYIIHWNYATSRSLQRWWEWLL
ncbi:hypothetical protein ES332_D02G020700v1 [Gossypium tomentosum]|uniref:Phorbol-ester/DAG-type domain-containing protein n=1 Tax=Gossypium tomentosum TaxID=34277 RepID=A0A5D2LR47_GOSTO|nr:hypothetical protein ES332_D02G020700v1 [Gossypium tomentosum]